jgi:hypothetical protein
MTIQFIDGYPATRRLTVDEAEVENLVDIDGRCVPFGYLFDKWKQLIGGMQEGDELWFSASGLDENGLSGYEAFLLVRDGKVIDSLLTAIGCQ